MRVDVYCKNHVIRVIFIIHGIDMRPERILRQKFNLRKFAKL